jgi:predicted nucleotidyltransferase
MNPAVDPIIGRFKQALDALYGGRIDRVVLFGSRARGEAHEDSDYDVAVFLKTLGDRWQELDRLADLRVTLLDETGAFFDAKPYPAEAYNERTQLMREIRRDGVDV